MYLLKEMTQICTVIKDFINEIKTQFFTTIHVLCIMLLNILKKSFSFLCIS